jgi:hypothetical protein
MSISPGFQPGAGATGGISDVVSQDDLTRFAQIAGVLRYLTAPLDPPPPPDQPTSISPGTMQSVFRNTYAALAQSGVDNAIAHKEAAEAAADSGDVGWRAAWLINLVALTLEPLARVLLGALDAIRKGIDPAVGGLAVQVMNEFLGTDLTINQLPMGLGTGDHIARAQAIGALLYNQLEREFAPAGGQVVPTTAPAETFSGLAINFGLASGIMGLIGGAVPFGFHFEELRELGEEVARNIGLGRLVRQALRPLIQILVAQPLTWALNTKYRPTQFAEAMLVNPYLNTQLPQDQLYNAMHLLGYSDDKIQAFIQMHQKRLSVADVKLLVENGFWQESQAETYVKNMGYPQELVQTVLLVEELKQQRGYVTKLVDQLETDVVHGWITIDEYNQVVNALPISESERHIASGLLAYKQKARAAARPHQLSGGELFYAFAAGILTSSDLTDRWTAQGLPQADQDVRLQLWLERLNRLHELEQAKLTAYQEKQKVFLEKQGGTKPGPVPPIPPVPPFPLG